MHGSSNRIRAASAPQPSRERWSRRGIFTVLLCGLVGAIDSFDTQMIGFTGRLIATDLGFPVAHLGWLFSAGQLGGVLGSLLFGSLADRFGRARMLVLTAAFTGAFTVATLFARSYDTLLLLRFLTGVGLGGVMPCFLGLGVEAMPVRSRVALTPVLFATFPLGGVVGAWVSAPLIEHHGWRGVFALGAALLGAAAVLTLPLTRAGARQQAVDSKSGGQLRELFSAGRARITLPLWLLFLTAPAGIYLLALWMPPLLQLLGVPAPDTSRLVGMLNIGALVVSLAGGSLLARWGPFKLLAPTLLIGAACFAALGAVRADFPLLAAVAIIAGAALGGSVSMLVSLAANAYPPACRATGIGWAMAVSRLGQMSAAIPVGWMLSGGVPPHLALALCGVPVALGLPFLAILDRNMRRAGRLAS